MNNDYMTPPTASKFFRPVDAKKKFGVPRSTTYRWAKKGHLTIYRLKYISVIETAQLVKYITQVGGPTGGL